MYSNVQNYVHSVNSSFMAKVILTRSRAAGLENRVKKLGFDDLIILKEWCEALHRLLASYAGRLI